jgi:hypothetical protein
VFGDRGIRRSQVNPLDPAALAASPRAARLRSTSSQDSFDSRRPSPIVTSSFLAFRRHADVDQLAHVAG